MPIATTINGFDEGTNTVAVTFTSGDIAHKRQVNAVLAEDGTYDEQATATRVEEVARGVAVKIALGVIVAPEPAADEEA